MVIDDHIHVHEWGYRPGDPEYEVDFVIRQMDECGVDVAIIEDSLAYVGLSQEASNDHTKTAVDAYPDRLVGFANIKPPQGAAACIAEIDRCIGDWNFRGIKLHPMADSFSADDADLVDPVIERVIRYDVPVWFHTGHQPYATPMQVAALGARFPEAKLIIGHLGHGMIYDALWAAQSTPNVWLDISLQAAPAIHRACREAPPEKLIFGSDAPYGDMQGIRDAVDTAPLDAQQKEMVLGGTIARLCGLPWPAAGAA